MEITNNINSSHFLKMSYYLFTAHCDMRMILLFKFNSYQKNLSGSYSKCLKSLELLTPYQTLFQM